MACVSSFIYGMMIELIDLSKVVAGRQLYYHFALNYQEFICAQTQALRLQLTRKLAI